MEKAESAPAGGPAGLARNVWETVRSLFDFRKADAALAQRIPEADLRAAAVIFAAAALLGAALSLVVYAETLYFEAFTFKALTEASGGVAPEPDFGSLGPFAFLVAITGVLTFFMNLFQDGIVYYALRLTGGKGTFTRQYYLSSFVALATVVSSSVLLLGPVPCMGLPAVAAYVILGFYFMFWVRCRAYARVHDLSHLQVFTIVLLSCIPVVAILLYANGAVAGALHIPQTQALDLTNMTNITGV